MYCVHAHDRYINVAAVLRGLSVRYQDLGDHGLENGMCGLFTHNSTYFGVFTDVSEEHISPVFKYFYFEDWEVSCPNVGRHTFI